MTCNRFIFSFLIAGFIVATFSVVIPATKASVAAVAASTASAVAAVTDNLTGHINH